MSLTCPCTPNSNKELKNTSLYSTWACYWCSHFPMPESMGSFFVGWPFDAVSICWLFDSLTFRVSYPQMPKMPFSQMAFWWKPWSQRKRPTTSSTNVAFDGDVQPTDLSTASTSTSEFFDKNNEREKKHKKRFFLPFRWKLTKMDFRFFRHRD